MYVSGLTPGGKIEELVEITILVCMQYLLMSKSYHKSHVENILICYFISSCAITSLHSVLYRHQLHPVIPLQACELLMWPFMLASTTIDLWDGSLSGSLLSTNLKYFNLLCGSHLNTAVSVLPFLQYPVTLV